MGMHDNLVPRRMHECEGQAGYSEWWVVYLVVSHAYSLALAGMMKRLSGSAKGSRPDNGVHSAERSGPHSGA